MTEVTTRKCPRCGRIEPAHEAFCYCGYIYPNASPTALTPPAEEKPRGPLTCPICRQMTDSLKTYLITYRMIFFLVYAKWWEREFVACPTCMRRLIRRRLLVNLPTAHFLWPALAIILLPRYLASYTHGHTVIKGPGRIARFLDAVGDHSLQYICLCVAIVCTAFLAFTASRPHPFDTSQLVLDGLIVLFFWRLLADIRASRSVAGSRAR